MRAAAAAAVIGLGAMLGCASDPVAPGAPPPAPAAPAAAAEERPKESRTAYIRRVFETDRATFGDACRAMLSFVKESHSDAGFREILGELVGLGVADGGWDLGPDDPVTKGHVAYMMCRALGIRGGLTMTVLGITRRYAFRECVHEGLMLGRSSGEYVSGRQLLDYLTTASIYREEGSLDAYRH